MAGARNEGRERAAAAIGRVHRVADLVATGAPLDDVVAAVTRELRELLRLHDCWLELPPDVYVMPTLQRGGSIDGSERHWFQGGVALSEDGIELPVLEQGDPVARVVLIGDPTHAVTIEERVVAVAARRPARRRARARAGRPSATGWCQNTVRSGEAVTWSICQAAPISAHGVGASCPES